jgi:hypothetical protein
MTAEKKGTPFSRLHETGQHPFFSGIYIPSLHRNVASNTGHGYLNLSPNGPGTIAGAEKTSQQASLGHVKRPEWADFSPYADRCHQFPT